MFGRQKSIPAGLRAIMVSLVFSQLIFHFSMSMNIEPRNLNSILNPSFYDFENRKFCFEKMFFSLNSQKIIFIYIFVYFKFCFTDAFYPLNLKSRFYTCLEMILLTGLAGNFSKGDLRIEQKNWEVFTNYHRRSINLSLRKFNNNAEDRGLLAHSQFLRFLVPNNR